MYRFINSLSISAKIVLPTIMTLSIGIVAIFFQLQSARTSIEAETEQSLKEKVEATFNLLESFQKDSKDQDEFIKRAQEVIYGLRWGENKSGYMFLMSKSGSLLIYPPDPKQEGNVTRNQQMLDAGKKRNSSLAVYPNAKPGTDDWYDKMTYIIPSKTGDWMIAGGAYLDAAAKQFENQLIIVSIVIAGIILLVGLFIFFVRNEVSRRVQRIISTLEKIKQGDFSNRIVSNGKDELGVITNQISSTQSILRELIEQQSNLAGSLHKVSNNLDENMSKTSESVSNQSQQVDQLVNAMQDINQSVENVTNNAKLAAEGTNKAHQTAQDGTSIIESCKTEINSLDVVLSQSAHSIQKVEQDAQQIGTIVETIDAISEQTNLLALNAAIEAARAGESGRGFAVVADEVRQLAKRTQDATTEINSMIDGLQQGTAKSVEQMNSSVQKATLATGLADKAGESFSTIVDQVGQLTTSNLQVASAAEQQRGLTDVINQDLVSIRNGLEITDGAIKNLVDDANILNDHATTMNSELKRYTV